MRVLLVEDSVNLQKTLSIALRKSNYAVDVSGDGEDGLRKAESYDYDLIVLDLMLPKLDGISVLQRLRDGGKKTHVLLLTARDSVSDRVLGLKAGADDYLVKPFALDELLARVETLCRRAYGNKCNRIAVADLEMDTSAKKVWRADVLVPLKPSEYQLLEYLVRRSGQVVSRFDIESHLYDDRFDAMSNVVESTISSLRRKISQVNPATLIHTRRGLGYIVETEQP